MINSVKKATIIMEFLKDRKEGVSLTDLSRNLKMGFSTLHSSLSTLVALGYVKKDSTTLRYTLGIKSFLLSAKYEESDFLLGRVTPYMERIYDKFNETIVISVLRNYKLIILKRIVSSREIISVFREAENQIHCYATGKVLLAYLDKEGRKNCLSKNQLQKFTPYTITDKQKLYRELAKIIENGYAVSKQESSPGAAAVAVPVFSSKGSVFASMGMALPFFRFKGQQEKDIINYFKVISEQMNRNFKP
jgi:IclR family transcriptional regulator, KDG regulon repressor